MKSWRGWGGGGDDASVFVTNQVQIFAVVMLGEQFDGHILELINNS